jgi:hypothetical protein
MSRTTVILQSENALLKEACLVQRIKLLKLRDILLDQREYIKCPSIYDLENSCASHPSCYDCWEAALNKFLEKI